MASKNGIKKAVTAPRMGTSTTDVEKGFNTKSMTIASQYPAPDAPAADWLCADHPEPEIFHPVDEIGLAMAQGVCGPCPMREACLDLGLVRGEWGVWGGVLLEGGKVLDRPREVRGSSVKSLQAAEKAGRLVTAAA